MSDEKHPGHREQRDVPVRRIGNPQAATQLREEFARQYPAYVETVLAAYEKARLWAIQNPDEFHTLFATNAKLDDPVVKIVLQRTDLSNPQIGDEQKKVILASGDVLKQNKVISSDTDVNATVDALIEPRYVRDVASKNLAQK